MRPVQIDLRRPTGPGVDEEHPAAMVETGTLRDNQIRDLLDDLDPFFSADLFPCLNCYLLIAPTGSSSIARTPSIAHRASPLMSARKKPSSFLTPCSRPLSSPMATIASGPL